MKPEEQRIAIAEACGWEWSGEDNLPNYPSDLNAMHEAEKILNTNQAADYCELLRPIICGCWRLVHATAAQRAEAFLRTLKLWTD